MRRIALHFFTLILLLAAGLAQAQGYATVEPGLHLQFGPDYGAHPVFRTEWWYVTGWLQTPDGKPLGFQVTFFRSATGHGRSEPSRFAPRQLIVAHAALSDPVLGKLLHDQKAAREAFGLAYAKTGDTDLKLDQWKLRRGTDGNYLAEIAAKDFSLHLQLQPTQPMLLQGEQGYSQKGPSPRQASYYYSEPQLRVTGSIARGGKQTEVSGSAWLDHEWSTSYLGADARGWDWVGANLDDGGAMMAFRMRGKDGNTLWAHATRRDADGKLSQYDAGQVRFLPRRRWTSSATGSAYPVEMALELGAPGAAQRWQLLPLMDDQELDSRRTTRAVYWEGAVRVQRDGNTVGKAYLELTGYQQALIF